MPMEESQKVHNNNSSQIESLRTSLNAVYIDVIKNAESAQIKFPLKSKARENVCSRDNLLSYIALTIRKRCTLSCHCMNHGYVSGVYYEFAITSFNGKDMMGPKDKYIFTTGISQFFFSSVDIDRKLLIKSVNIGTTCG